MGNLAALLLRVVLGGLMTGHGAQKLFGWWGGYGLDGTSAWLESMGLRPGRRARSHGRRSSEDSTRSS